MPKLTRIAALLLVAVAVVLAIVAVGIGRRAARPVAGNGAPARQESSSAELATVPVVVAAADLPAGTPLVAASVKRVYWAQRPTGGYGDAAAVVGGVPLVDIPAGVPMTARMLARGLAMALKPGERALAVPVDEQAGAGNRILPGDFVDVFVSLKAPSAIAYQPAARAAATDLSQTRLLLSRLRVLAYGGDDLPSLPPKAAPASTVDDGKAIAAAMDDSAGAPKPSQNQPTIKDAPHTAVLAVPVDEASQLLLAVQNGRLSLAVRQPDDDGRPDDALFAPPQPVLSARADLSAEQKQQLLQPENLAYAGIDGTGLAGHGPAVRSARPARVSAYPSIQIIRGSSDDSARPVRANP